MKFENSVKGILFSFDTPKIGDQLETTRIGFQDGKMTLSGWTTGSISYIKQMGDSIYQIAVKDGMYIVQVG